MSHVVRFLVVTQENARITLVAAAEILKNPTFMSTFVKKSRRSTT